MDSRELPRISVIIPARNEEEYIEAALGSVLEQSYPHDRLECIVADNGSTDRTEARTREYASQIATVPIRLVTEPLPGVGRAKNRGAEAATGSILIFLDADSRMSTLLAADVARAHDPTGAQRWPAGSIRVAADSGHLLDRCFFGLMELGKVWFGVRAQMLYCDRPLFIDVGGFRSDLMLGEDVDFLTRVKQLVRARGAGTVGHVRSSWISTSPRRLQSKPFRLGMLAMFGRWALAFAGIGRTRKY